MRASMQAILVDPARTETAERSSAGPIRVGRIGAASLAAIRSEWIDLVGRALEANVFLDPAFALPLVGQMRPRQRPDFIVARDGASRLIGLCPVSFPRLPAIGLARGFANKQACLGLPLLDRAYGAAAFAAMLEWVGQRRPAPAALLLTEVPAAGRFARDILGELVAEGRAVVLATRQRAGLRARAGSVHAFSSAKSRKEHQRQHRRLAQKGTRSYSSARSPEDVARACETFLALEDKGWKGARGTALAADPARACFARTMARQMAEAGRCRIDALEVDGCAVAMGIVLVSDGQAYFWKTAYDPALASLSPGVQFARALAEVQLADLAIGFTDSCAVPGHPMIDRIWPDRLELWDVAVSVRPGRTRVRALALALERLRGRLRARLKAARAVLNGAARHRKRSR